MLNEAQVAILVCGDVSLEKHKGYWVQDCAAATENILLAAHALGLGGVWVGVNPDDERVVNFCDLLDIPQKVVPFALVAIGYPAEHHAKAPHFDSARVHYEQWPQLPR